jgi:hypothetical protein
MVSGAPIYLPVSASFSHEADRIAPTEIVIWMLDRQWRADACPGVLGIGSHSGKQLLSSANRPYADYSPSIHFPLSGKLPRVAFSTWMWINLWTGLLIIFF